MASSSTAATSGDSLFEKFEAVDTRLYRLQHLARFVDDVACAAPPGRECAGVLAESVAILAGMLADECKALRVDLEVIQYEIHRGQS